MSISHELFQERLKHLLGRWKSEDCQISKYKALLVCTGKRDKNVLSYLKSVAFHLWLFGLEIADVVIALTNSQMRIATLEGKKARVLEGLVPTAQGCGVTLKILSIPREGSGDSQYSELLSMLRTAAAGDPSGIGGLPGLKQQGPVFDAFAAALQGSDVKVADASKDLGILLAIHDLPASIQTAKKAGFLVSQGMNNAIGCIEKFIDTRKPVKHSKLAEDIQAVFTNPAKSGIKLKADNCDYAYPPIVQSGGHFNLKLGTESDDSKLHAGVVMLHLGAKYISECANICRTIVFQPNPSIEAVYKRVLAAHKAAIDRLRSGVKLCDVHAAAVKTLDAGDPPGLSAKLTKHVGFATGLELRDKELMISGTNEVKAVEGMVFNVCVGVSGLENPSAETSKDKAYSVQVADTVLVAKDGPPEVLTKFSHSAWEDVSYLIKDEEEEESEGLDDLAGSPSKENKHENLGRGRRNAMRQNEAAEHQAELAQRKKKQDALSKRKNEETYKRLTAKGSAQEGAESHMRSVLSTECYTAASRMPVQRELLVTIDTINEALLVPIMGVYVPLHITTVKAIGYSQDGEANDRVHAHVRIQFHCTHTYEARSSYPQAVFIKELSFRSARPDAAQRFVTEAQALRRAVATKDREAAERATLVKQETLQRHQNRQPYTLNDVWVHPPMNTKRKAPGRLEGHFNGFRYIAPNNNDHLDITFSNIKHAFFQEAEKELITIIHFRLKDPIMAGKKKVWDVQFNTEVMGDNALTADGRRNAYDPDEIEEEARDRERKKRINTEWKRFTKRIQDAWERDFSRLKLEWDVPFRSLAFQGITGKSTVVLLPTVHCLVQLVEPPYTVISLQDVEIVNLERVGFNSKSFDIVVVFKDFDRDTQLIGSVPTANLDDIKRWLTMQDIKFFENKFNLQWKAILKTIQTDPDSFMENGGWAGFLEMDQSDPEGEEEEEVSEEFKPSSDDDDDDDSDDSDEESVVDSEDESGSYSEDSDEESGKDWDDLEDEARRADKLRNELEEEDVRDVRTQKRKGDSGASSRPAKKRR